MGHRNFKVQIDNREVDIIVEDDLAGGKLMPIVKATIHLDLLDQKFSVDDEEYTKQIIQNMIVSAPFSKDIDSLNKMGIKLYLQLCEIAGELYPLTPFLLQKGMIYLGKKGVEGMRILKDSEKNTSELENSLTMTDKGKVSVQ